MQRPVMVISASELKSHFMGFHSRLKRTTTRVLNVGFRHHLTQYLSASSISPAPARLPNWLLPLPYFFTDRRGKCGLNLCHHNVGIGKELLGHVTNNTIVSEAQTRGTSQLDPNRL